MITDEQLKELIELGKVASQHVPMFTTSHFTSGAKASVIRMQTRYRQLSFVLAADLAKELIELRAKLARVEPAQP